MWRLLAGEPSRGTLTLVFIQSQIEFFGRILRDIDGTVEEQVRWGKENQGKGHILSDT